MDSKVLQRGKSKDALKLINTAKIGCEALPIAFKYRGRTVLLEVIFLGIIAVVSRN